MDNGYAEDSGRLVIGNTDNSDDSFYLECGDYYFNISNLVSEQTLKSSGNVKAPIAPVYVRKQKEERIYPSRHHVESIGDVDIGMLFAKKARPVRSAESVIGYDGGRSSSATKHRDSSSEYFANSGRNMYHSSNGTASSRSVILINDDDIDIDYSCHRRLEVKNRAPSTIDGARDDSQRYPNPASCLKKDLNLPAAGGQMEVEIMPGVFAPLRGSEETWRAIQAGNVEIVECVCCCNRIQCIADAEYILCPECRVVSPVGNRHRGSPTLGRQKSRGVGLGLLATAA
jgi:hypothetical protein